MLSTVLIVVGIVLVALALLGMGEVVMVAPEWQLALAVIGLLCLIVAALARQRGQ